jgi:hypothetical protein
MLLLLLMLLLLRRAAAEARVLLVVLSPDLCAVLLVILPSKLYPAAAATGTDADTAAADVPSVATVLRRPAVTLSITTVAVHRLLLVPATTAAAVLILPLLSPAPATAAAGPADTRVRFAVVCGCCGTEALCRLTGSRVYRPTTERGRRKAAGRLSRSRVVILLPSRIAATTAAAAATAAAATAATATATASEQRVLLLRRVAWLVDRVAAVVPIHLRFPWGIPMIRPIEIGVVLLFLPTLLP